MAYVNALFNLPQHIRAQFRQLENLEKKIIKNKWSTAFNKTYIKEKLLPNYTRIYIHIYIFF